MTAQTDHEVELRIWKHDSTDLALAQTCAGAPKRGTIATHYGAFPSFGVQWIRMCFSASASFIAGGTLSAAGAETLRHAKTRERLPLAAMPLLFGIQQAVEGVVWVSFGIPWLNALATHVFVFFSHVLWPTYVPIAVLLIEKEQGRRLVLKILALIGLATSLSLFYHAFLVGTPVSYASAHGIVYVTSLPMVPLGLGFYVLATCIACLASSHKFIRVLGIAMMGSLAIAYWSYEQAFYSVWCFFAAILSFIIYVHLRTDIVEKVKSAATTLRKSAETALKARYGKTS